MPALHVAIYLRISSDRDLDRRGVNLRQLPDCQSLHASSDLAHLPSRVYEDNDVSATRRNGKQATRPAYQSLLAAIESRTVAAVVAWDLDRLFRDPLDQEQFFILAERVTMTRLHTIADNINITTGDGLLVARIKAAVAAEEARKVSLRLTRKHVELKERGIYVGRHRPFGHVRVPTGLELHPTEAPALARVIDMVLAGQSLNACARYLTSSGFTTTAGNEWTGAGVRACVKAARVAGLVERDVPTRTRTGIYDIIGSPWPPIVPEATWRAAVAILSRNARTFTPRGVSSTNETYWLTPILYCQACTHRLGAHPTYQSGRKVRRYFCVAARGGCNRIGINAARLEDLAVDLIRDRLRHPAIDTAPASPVDLAAIADTQSRLKQLADDYYLGELDRDAFHDLRARLRAKLETLTPATPTAPTTLATLGRFDASWPGMDGAQRSAVASAVFEWIKVGTATPGRGWDPTRIAVKYR